MKSSSTTTLVMALATALLGSARPFTASRALGLSDSAIDMDDVVAGFADCKEVAVIFARGTFDSGNIGVWVGPQYRQALDERINSLAFQGVDSTAYPADLRGFLADGGSNSGAQSMANTVEAYTATCPDSVIIISGWSQGALVAHKALNLLSSETQSKVAALTTFGDPQRLFGEETLPEDVALDSQCLTGTTLDPLCADIPDDFKLPTSVNDIVGPFKSFPGVAQGLDQTKAAASLVARFPGQLLAAGDAFFSTLTSNPQRLLLSPQHFMYGNTGLTTASAEFVASLPAVAGK